jgi:polysaccharide export outer membrane protein
VISSTGCRKRNGLRRGPGISTLVSRGWGRREKATASLGSSGQAEGGRYKGLITFGLKAIVFFCAVGLSGFAYAQDVGVRGTRDGSPLSRSSDSSDLVKENLQRVAASAVQIKAVLIKDAGLLVELKNWVAKETGDNGQVVEDSAVSDQGIFERLDQDLAFRSVATRLVQRYGYLLPSVNPDSDAAKEQDLILKERARRLVQIEGQEDALSLQPRAAEKVEQTSGCDAQRNSECNGEPAARRRQATPRLQETPDLAPSLPLLPDSVSPADLARTLLAASGGEDGGGQSPIGADAGFTLTSNPTRRAQDGIGIGPSARPEMGGASVGGNPLLDLIPPASGADLVRGGVSGGKEPKIVRMPGSRGGLESKDFAPVSMERKVNPYSDVPSLYDLYVQASPRDRNLDRFGLEIFRNGTRELDAIPMDLPVGPDYVVGPGDGLAIDLWGGFSQRFVRTVDREGRISLPEAGPLSVSGRTLGDVQQAVQQALRSQYQGASADVSLSRLRTVRVYVVGEVAEPGAYDISSLSTPLNALLAAGGVTQRGSLRGLKHYRGKQLIEEVDAYDLLLRGVGSDAKRLENGDSLMVPPVGSQVTVSGMVRRPAIYELHEESSLADVIGLAGGILPAAALQHIELQRLQAHEKRTMQTIEISPSGDTAAIEKQLSAVKIEDGDEVHIFPIAGYNENAIYLQGHVQRPGRYSYREGMKLTDVIASYGDLLPEPAGHYAEIVRLNAPDFRPSVESFDLAAALADPAESPKLHALDTVRIFSRYDFEATPTVWIGGEVRSPGKYRTSGQAHLRDAIYLAGGVSPDAALDAAQLFRTQADGTMKIVSVNLGAALAGNPADNFILQPRDRLLIHRSAGRVEPATVYIKGEVAKPGRYPLTSNMHVEDLIGVAGGLKRSADNASADLTSYAAGATQQLATQSRTVELSAALTGEESANVALRDGDVLTIRQNPGWNDIAASATVKGEVEHAGSFGIKPGERLSSLLTRAGGFGPQAYPYGAVLMRREVRDLEMKSRSELVERMKLEQANLKTLPENTTDERNAKLTALAQTQTALTQLQENQPIGRVVVHIQPNVTAWRNTEADVPVRDGDVLLIPKKADYVAVTGQVFNPTAIGFRSGRSARWYLAQAGGLTQLADKKAAFVIRADGSVIGSKNNPGFWSGDPLEAVLKPGDSIVVPERAPNVGARNWNNIFQAAQVASSLAFAVAYLKP